MGHTDLYRLGIRYWDEILRHINRPHGGADSQCLGTTDQPPLSHVINPIENLWLWDVMFRFNHQPGWTSDCPGAQSGRRSSIFISI